ncbi:MAG: DUF642 domain-containing protein [Terriglobia bacterium]
MTSQAIDGRIARMRSFSRMAGNLAVWKVALGIAVVGLMASSARANLLTNGSFETPLAPLGGFMNFTSGSTAITGWTVTGPEVSVVNGSYTSFGINFPAEDGNQWLDLTGDLSNAVEGVEQTVATSPGATYELSYFIGNVANPGGPYGTTSRVNVLVDGALILTSTNSLGAGTGRQTWEQFSTSFVAPSSSTVIEFLNEDPSTDNTNGLDNVVLTQGTTSSVPETSTFIMFALAFCAFGAFRFRNAIAH